jgi:hypothetical protein
MMSGAPMHAGRGQRSHGRVDLLAQVQVTREAEVYIMSTMNISRGGVFIRCDPSECPDLRAGAQVEIVIFVAEDPGVEDVSLQARIVRVEPQARGQIPSGFGLQFVGLDADQTQKLERLIEAARS